MKIETVDVHAKPILFITRSCTMKPAEVASAMGQAFELLGEYFDDKQIVPVGPPLAIYRAWDDESVTFDLAFPVGRDDLQKADGEVAAGHSPSGLALKLVHKGPYSELSGAYAELEAEIADAGLPPSSLTWEVYLNEPGKVAEEELLTEIYSALPEQA